MQRTRKIKQHISICLTLEVLLSVAPARSDVSTMFTMEVQQDWLPSRIYDIAVEDRTAQGLPTVLVYQFLKLWNTQGSKTIFPFEMPRKFVYDHFITIIHTLCGSSFLSMMHISLSSGVMQISTIKLLSLQTADNLLSHNAKGSFYHTYFLHYTLTDRNILMYLFIRRV